MQSKKIKKSLQYSILDGTFYSSMVGFVESFLAPFAVFLNANLLQLGLLSSLPQSLGSLSELFSDRLIRWVKSRKRIVIIGSCLQGLIYLPIIFLFLVNNKVNYLIFLVCLYWIFVMIISPAWSSWMGDLVKENKRGMYFGNRNKIAGVTSFITFMLGGFILQHYTENIHPYAGFVVLFILAFISRMISVSFVSRKYEPECKITGPRYKFREFISSITATQFGVLTLYLCFMNFAVYLAAPYFTAYMLYDLKFNYLTFTYVSATAMIVKYLTMPVWGKAADRFGAKKVMTLSGYLMPFVPLMWIFSHNILFLLIIQAFSGFVWAGFELASFNFMFDTTTSEHRAAMVAYYNVINGVGLILGSLLGSYFVEHNSLFWSSYLFVFLVSFILRILTSIVFIPKMSEIRHVQDIAYPKLLTKIITTMPTMGIIYHIIPLARRKSVK